MVSENWLKPEADACNRWAMWPPGRSPASTTPKPAVTATRSGRCGCRAGTSRHTMPKGIVIIEVYRRLKGNIEAATTLARLKEIEGSRDAAGLGPGYRTLKIRTNKGRFPP